jgi:ATP synthase protein I
MVEYALACLWSARGTATEPFTRIVTQKFHIKQLLVSNAALRQGRLTHHAPAHSNAPTIPRGGFDVSDPDHARRLAELDARIAAVKATHAPKPRVDEHYSQANLAWRMVIELVAGLGIGFGIGYGLDSLFGTVPIFLVLFTLLGLAAGVKTMLRSATEVQKTKAATVAEAEQADQADTTSAPRG